MITASKSFIFKISDNSAEEKICIKNLAPAWSSGSIYLSKEEAQELLIALDNALKSKPDIAF